MVLCMRYFRINEIRTQHQGDKLSSHTVLCSLLWETGRTADPYRVFCRFRKTLLATLLFSPSPKKRWKYSVKQIWCSGHQVGIEC